MKGKSYEFRATDEDRRRALRGEPWALSDKREITDEMNEQPQAIPFAPYYQDEAATIYHGDCMDVLADN